MSICVTPPFECRLYPKSIFLVPDIKSLYKHGPGLRLGISIDCYSKVNSNESKEAISAKFSNCHFKLNILGKVIMIVNRGINLCPEIPVDCLELCSEHLKCFPVSSSSTSLGELKSKPQKSSAHFWHIIYKYFCQFINSGPRD